MYTFGLSSLAIILCSSSLSFRATLKFYRMLCEISYELKSSVGDSTIFSSIITMFYCLKRGLSSPQATDILPSVQRGALSPRADPGFGFGFWLFSTIIQSSKPSSNSSLCWIAVTSWMGTKCSMIMFTSFNYLTSERFSSSSSSLSWAMNSWISLFCSYAIFSLCFNFYSCLRRCSTSSFRVKFLPWNYSYSYILFWSSSFILLYCCFFSSSSMLASRIFFSCSLASYFSLLPFKKAYFISFSLLASSYCLFFSAYFCSSRVWALFFNSCFWAFAWSRMFFFSSYSFSFIFWLMLSLFMFPCRGFLTLLSIRVAPSGGRVPSNCLFNLSISYWYYRMSASLGSSLIFGLFLIFLAW